jgi:hypothetical protein
LPWRTRKQGRGGQRGTRFKVGEDKKTVSDSLFKKRLQDALERGNLQKRWSDSKAKTSREKAVNELMRTLDSATNLEMKFLGNGKIPNVYGPGLLVIQKRTLSEHPLEEVWSYSISDTHKEDGIWEPKGGQRGSGDITAEKAKTLILAYANLKTMERNDI